MLAGVSADYYVRLERGNLAGVSDSVLQSLASALQLDDAERDYLYDLARAATPSPRRTERRPAPGVVRPSVQRIVDALVDVPAFVQNDRLDVLAANQLGKAVYSPLFHNATGPPNHARFVFFDDRSRDFYPNWNLAAAVTVALLQKAAGRDSRNRELIDLVGELSTRSEAFAARWATHDVRVQTSGIKEIRHPVVGDLTMTFESMDISADEGLTFRVYTPEPGSPTEEALAILGSWAATAESGGEPHHTPSRTQQSTESANQGSPHLPQRE